MAGNGIVSIGECMLELSGKGGRRLAHGICRRHAEHALGAAGADGPERATNYISAFGDDPFSSDQIAFFEANGIGVGESPIVPGARPGLYAITLTGAERSFTYWRNDSAARQLASDPEDWQKAWKTSRLSTFPESLWQFSTRRPARCCSMQ